jgi:flagellar assembly factor FliW
MSVETVMQVETTRFGVVEIEPDSVIRFVQPVIGFQEISRYVLIPGPEGTVVTWLQSVERGDLAFLMMDPKMALPDYRAELSPHELAELGATTVDELEVFTLLVVPADPMLVRTNLKAPILINRAGRVGKQTVLDRSNYPVQWFLRAQEASDAAAGEGGAQC